MLVAIPECKFSDGEGVGGAKREAGFADTREDCVVLDRSAYPTANGVTYGGNGGTMCYAEFGVTSSNGNVGWQSCIFPCK